MNSNYRLILGSKSPRRKELLKALDLEFEIKTLETDESYPEDLPKRAVAKYLSKKKSEAFHNLAEEELLITSDTTVVLNDMLLEKASGAHEAKEMIQKLSGKTHSVITGVCLRSKTKTVVFDVETKVTFNDLNENQIDYYIQNYQPFDKAGAYGIQEWIGMIGIKNIEGDYYNVVGFPLHRFYQELMKF